MSDRTSRTRARLGVASTTVLYAWRGSRVRSKAEATFIAARSDIVSKTVARAGYNGGLCSFARIALTLPRGRPSNAHPKNDTNDSVLDVRSALGSACRFFFPWPKQPMQQDLYFCEAFSPIVTPPLHLSGSRAPSSPLERLSPSTSMGDGSSVDIKNIEKIVSSTATIRKGWLCSGDCLRMING